MADVFKSPLEQANNILEDDDFEVGWDDNRKLWRLTSDLIKNNKADDFVYNFALESGFDYDELIERGRKDPDDLTSLLLVDHFIDKDKFPEYFESPNKKENWKKYLQENRKK